MNLFKSEVFDGKVTQSGEAKTEKSSDSAKENIFARKNENPLENMR